MHAGIACFHSSLTNRPAINLRFGPLDFLLESGMENIELLAPHLRTLLREAFAHIFAEHIVLAGIQKRLEDDVVGSHLLVGGSFGCLVEQAMNLHRRQTGRIIQVIRHIIPLVLSLSYKLSTGIYYMPNIYKSQYPKNPPI